MCLSLVGCNKTNGEAQTDKKEAQTENKADSKAEAPSDSKQEGGMSAYIRKQIESEAKTNLKAISAGAISYYEAEHADETGMNFFSNVFPESKGVQLGPDVNESTINKKHKQRGCSKWNGRCK